MAALAAGATVVATGLVALTGSAAQAAATGGVGATLPYVEVQAENAATNGTVIGPAAAYGTLPGEASYRKAVTLQRHGQVRRVHHAGGDELDRLPLQHPRHLDGGSVVHRAALALRQRDQAVRASR